MHKAFTLIELLIVLVVMGVLASVALPNFASTVERTHRKDAENQLMLIHSAQKMYASRNHGVYWGPAVGATAAAKLANINLNLGQSILANGHDFDCSVSGGGALFTCTASRVGGSAYTITITQADISEGVNPSCSPSSACP